MRGAVPSAPSRSFLASGAAPDAAELERAARTLWVRSRREAGGALAGGYHSAFRGGGIEFEESRPYLPGDDVRSIDWNATARTGDTYVKRFREERDQIVLLAVDVSASMGFGSVGTSKAGLAARTAALIAAAALRAGDRVGLLTFDLAVRDEIPAGRGTAHGFHLLRSLVAAPPAVAGGTDLPAVLRRVHERVRRRSILFVFSDFRDDALFARAGEGGGQAVLVAVARRHDLVACAIRDPRELALPRTPAFRMRDAERPGETFLFRPTSRGRARYQQAAEVRQRALVRRLRSDGAEVLPLRTDREPLRALGRFFQMRSVERVR